MSTPCRFFIKRWGSAASSSTLTFTLGGANRATSISTRRENTHTSSFAAPTRRRLEKCLMGGGCGFSTRWSGLEHHAHSHERSGPIHCRRSRGGCDRRERLLCASHGTFPFPGEGSFFRGGNGGVIPYEQVLDVPPGREVLYGNGAVCSTLRSYAWSERRDEQTYTHAFPEQGVFRFSCCNGHKRHAEFHRAKMVGIQTWRRGAWETASPFKCLLSKTHAKSHAACRGCCPRPRILSDKTTLESRIPSRKALRVDERLHQTRRSWR